MTKKTHGPTQKDPRSSAKTSAPLNQKTCDCFTTLRETHKNGEYKTAFS